MDVLNDAVMAMRTGAPHSSLTRQRAPWGFRFEAQRGAGFHILLQGACWLLPVSGEPVRLGAGDVVFLPRELGHALADEPSTTLQAARDSRRLGTGTSASVGAAGGAATVTMLCGAYRLDHTRTHPLLAEMPDVVHLPAQIGRHTALRGAVDLLAHELAAEPLPGTAGVVPALLDVLLLYILRSWYDEQGMQARSGWARALRDPMVSAALDAVHHAPAEPWTVQSLAARAGLGRSAFTERFTASVGMPPLTYLTWWRMTTAARLLRDTDLPLRSVAQRVGYATEYAFSKAFKRELGAPPGQYRTGHRTSHRSGAAERKDQPGMCT